MENMGLKKYIPKLYQFLAAGIILFGVFFLAKIIYNMILGINVPNELLEPSNIQMTQAIVGGKIPYLRDTLAIPGNRPGVSYEYPFLTCLTAAGLSYLFSGNVILAHYVLSIISIIGTGIIGGLIVKRYSVTYAGPAFVFVVLMFCHWRYGYISAAPDDFGLFLSILTLYLFTNKKIKYKPLVGAIGITLCFYTKQYFIFIAVSMFLYMCLYSFSEAMKLFLYTMVLLVTSGIVITIFWPLFWDYSVLLLLLYACKPDGSLSQLIYTLQQFGYLSFILFGLLIILVFAAYKFFKNNKKEKKHLLHAEENDALVLFIIQIPVQMIALLILGTNDGAFLTYFLQLWVPSIVIVAVICLEKMIPSFEAETSKQLIYGAIFSVVVIFTLFFGSTKLPVHILNDNDLKEWQEAYDLIDEYRSSGKVIYAKTLAFKGLECGDDTYLTDHDGDINERVYDNWKNTEWQQSLFPDAGAIFETNIAYRDILREKAVNHEISLITHTGQRDMAFTDDFLEENGYTLLKTISLQTGNMDYDTEFWVVE